MDIKTALFLSYGLLGISLIALATVLAAYALHLQIPSPFFRPLMIVGYLWPAAAFSIAFFRKKLSGN